MKNKERFIFDGTQQQLIEMCKEKEPLRCRNVIAKWDDFEIYFNTITGWFQSENTEWGDICCYYLPEGVERPYGEDTLNDVEDILLKMGADPEFINKLIDLLNGIPEIGPVYTEEEYNDKLSTEIKNILGFDMSKIDTSNAKKMTQEEIDDMYEMENI